MKDSPLILLVDDELDFLEIVALKLGSSGFNPVVAHNAYEAIDAAHKLHPELILMDIHMPGETGTDAALTIKQHPETKHIKIAFFSSMKDPWPRTTLDRDRLVKAMGMEVFFEKSINLDVLAQRLKEIIGD